MHKKRILVKLSMVMALSCMFPSATMAAQAGWKQMQSGWQFMDAEGNTKMGWVSDNGKWYYISPADKVMQTGWQKIGNIWYFFDTRFGNGEGSMLTGWQWIDGNCYYFSLEKGSNEGALLMNTTTPDGFKVNADGKWEKDGVVVYEQGKGIPKNQSQARETKKTAKTTVGRGGGGGGRSGGGTGGTGNSSTMNQGKDNGKTESANDSQNQGSDSGNQPDANHGNTDQGHVQGGSQEQREADNVQQSKDVLVDAKTRVVNLGFSQYVTMQFAKGGLQDYDVYIDGTKINSAITPITDKGEVAKWETTVLSPKKIKAVRKSDGMEEEINLNEGEPTQAVQPGAKDNTASYVMTNGAISYFDYHLDNYDQSGKVREFPKKTTFALGEKTKEIHTKAPNAWYAPALEVNENGESTGGKKIIIKASLTTQHQKDWFNKVNQIKLLGANYSVSNPYLTFASRIEEGKYGSTGIIEIPTPQSNMRSRGEYFVNINAEGETENVTLAFQLVSETEYIMRQSTESTNPKRGENVGFTIKGKNGETFGNEILNVITHVELIKPSQKRVVLKNIDSYSLIGGFFKIFGKEPADANGEEKLVTDEVGIYTVRIEAKGYKPMTARFQVVDGESFGKNSDPKNTVKMQETDNQAVFADAITTASVGSGGGSNIIINPDGSTSGGSAMLNGYLIFDYDLLLNTLLLNELESLTPEAQMVLQRYFTQIPEYLLTKDMKKIYDFSEYFDEVKKKNFDESRYLTFKEYVDTAQVSKYKGPSNVKHVLEDGKLGALKSFRYSKGDEVPGFVRNEFLESEDIVLKLTDLNSDYLEKITNVYLDGLGTALRQDEYLKQMTIDTENKTLTVYTNVLRNSYTAPFIGMHTLKIEASGYKTVDFKFTVKAVNEKISLKLKEKENQRKEHYIGEDVQIEVLSASDDPKKGEFLAKLFKMEMSKEGESGVKEVMTANTGGTSSNDYYEVDKQSGVITIKSGRFQSSGKYTLYLYAQGYPKQTLEVNVKIDPNTSIGDEDEETTPKDSDIKIEKVELTTRFGSEKISIIHFAMKDGSSTRESANTKKVREFVDKLTRVQIGGKVSAKANTLSQVEEGSYSLIRDGFAVPQLVIVGHLQDNTEIVLTSEGVEEVRFTYRTQQNNPSDNQGGDSSGNQPQNPGNNEPQNPDQGQDQQPDNDSQQGGETGDVESGFAIAKLSKEKDFIAGVTSVISFKMKDGGSLDEAELRKILKNITELKVNDNVYRKVYNIGWETGNVFSEYSGSNGIPSLKLKGDIPSGSTITIKSEGKKAIIFVYNEQGSSNSGSGNSQNSGSGSTSNPNGGSQTNPGTDAGANQGQTPDTNSGQGTPQEGSNSGEEESEFVVAGVTKENDLLFGTTSIISFKMKNGGSIDSKNLRKAVEKIEVLKVEDEIYQKVNFLFGESGNVFIAENDPNGNRRLRLKTDLQSGSTVTIKFEGRKEITYTYNE